MLTADQFDALADPITLLFQEYETTIINDIARRLGNMDYASAAWQVQRLTESGTVYKNALKEIAKLTGKSERELSAMFKKAGVTAMRFDDSIYKAAELKPLPLNLSPAMLQVLTAGLSKTQGLLSNLTLTTAINSQQAFIKAADMAYLQISTGAMSYDQAIRSAVKNMASDGLSAVNYTSGHVDKIDVAMRRAVLTGVSQTTAELQLTRAQQMGVDLVQVSAHIGSRPSHAQWQGKIFSRSGTSRKYPDFVETGYGTGAGLGGWNCRHSFYPFFEGISENAYNAATLADYESRVVSYNGKSMSVYDGTQYQRAIERKIRYHKRQADALQAAGQSNAPELEKVKQWQNTMRDFVRQTGLQREPVRESIIRGGVKVAPMKTVTAPSIVKTPTLEEFENKIVKQDYETAGLYSPDGKLIFQKDGNKNSVVFSRDELNLMKDATLTHNHPSGNPFSRDDIALLADAKLQEIRATGKDYTYIMRNASHEANKLKFYQVEIQYEKARAEIDFEMMGTPYTTYADYSHQIWERFTQNLRSIGIKYERIPR